MPRVRVATSQGRPESGHLAHASYALARQGECGCEQRRGRKYWLLSWEEPEFSLHRKVVLIRTVTFLLFLHPHPYPGQPPTFLCLLGLGFFVFVFYFASYLMVRALQMTTYQVVISRGLVLTCVTT